MIGKGKPQAQKENPHDNSIMHGTWQNGEWRELDEKERHAWMYTHNCLSQVDCGTSFTKPILWTFFTSDRITDQQPPS